jgi:hypothetical protein
MRREDIQNRGARAMADEWAGVDEAGGSLDRAVGYA